MSETTATEPTRFHLPPLALTVPTPPATTLLFVRHTEVHNPRNVVYGRLPRFGLSKRGWEQAERVADYLREVPLAALYTSPLLRARQTAVAIAERHPHLRVRSAAALLEIKTGWQGTLNKDIPKGTSFYVDRKHEDDEVVEDIIKRLQAFVRRLLRQHPGQIVACVGHADPIAIITLATAGHDVTPKLLLQPLAPDRGAVVVFDYASPASVPVLHYANPQDIEPAKPDQYSGHGGASEGEAAPESGSPDGAASHDAATAQMESLAEVASPSANGTGPVAPQPREG